MRIAMLKRDFRLFVRCLIPAAVLTAVFAAVCAAAAFSASFGAESSFSPVKTAVVDGENSTLSSLVINVAAGSESISQLIEISVCSEADAMEGLQDGSFAAVIILPRGTVDGILSGADTKGTIYLSSAAAAHAEVVASAAAFGETMLAAGQYGIFSAEALIREQGLDAAFHEAFLSKYNTLLLLEALQAGTDYFEIRTTDFADTNMPTMAYYILCWLSFLLLLTPMLFSGLYSADLQKPILCRLRSYGITDSAFLLGKFLYPLGFLLVLCTCSLALSSLLTPLSLSFPAILWVILGVSCAATISGCVMLTSRNGVFLVTVLSAGGLLLCGGLIPRQALPDILLSVGALTPYGAVQNLLCPIFGGILQTPPLVAAVFYTAGLLLLTQRRLVRIRTGGEKQ